MSARQLVYMDESGDAGFKLDRGSSPALVIAGVIFDDPADAQATADRIELLRVQSGRSSRYQFHFTDMDRRSREDFFRAVRLFPFRVRAIVMAKDRIYPDSMLRRRGDYSYSYTAKMLLKHTFGMVEEAKLFVDGEAGRQSLREMVSYLRRECNTPGLRVIREVRFVPKREGNVLLQLADMVTSGIARSYRTDKSDHRVYRELIQPRLEDVWEFGHPKKPEVRRPRDLSCHQQARAPFGDSSDYGASVVSL
ncbi:MAG: DUF3800 domain-containing protein [Armatimonadetes bacterium]|nr:DUF3800 domain-containing protein [Armatimonadota bacterium]